MGSFRSHGTTTRKRLLADGVVHVAGIALAVLGAFGLAARSPAGES